MWTKPTQSRNHSGPKQLTFKAESTHTQNYAEKTRRNQLETTHILITSRIILQSVS